jgi:cytochrome c553
MEETRHAISMRLQKGWATFVAGVLLTLPWCGALAADAATLAAKGSGSVQPCAQCHGAKGEGQAGSGFPRLAGQAQGYLAKQLDDFRSGRRANPVMQPIAKALDAPSIQALSKYYSGLMAPFAAGTGKAPTTGDTAAAARLAHKGAWDRNVPACFACHGDNGTGIPPNFPMIAGQRHDYTAKQIRDWKSGARANDPQGLMKAVSDRLSDAEIDGVAAYLEQLR